jgi:hypothetical protein
MEIAAPKSRPMGWIDFASAHPKGAETTSQSPLFMPHLDDRPHRLMGKSRPHAA